MNADNFDSNETQHDDHTGKDSVRVLTSDEAIQLLRTGEPLVNCRVNRLMLQGEFTEPVVLERCQLSGLQTQDATFHAEFTLKQCRLRRPRFKRGTVFKGDCNWSGSHFHAFVMNRVTFEKTWKTPRTEFTHNMKVSASVFQAGIKGFSMLFDDWVEWRDCQIADCWDWRSANFSQGFVIESTQIHGDLVLRGTTVSKKLDVSGSKVTGTVDLSKTKLHDFVYLQDLETTESTRFCFANAICDFLHVDPEQLGERLLSEQENNHEQACLEYGLLKRNFSALHRYEEEDWAFYRFKVNQRRSRPLRWFSPLSIFGRLCNYLFLDIGCGYGVQPWRALMFGGFVILLFAGIYAGGISHFADFNPPVSSIEPGGWANRGLFGLLTSVSVFTAGFTGDHLNSATGWVLVPLALEAVVGTVLWGLFIVAFSRKVIR